jgi:hypothetical protein
VKLASRSGRDAKDIITSSEADFDDSTMLEDLEIHSKQQSISKNSSHQDSARMIETSPQNQSHTEPTSPMQSNHFSFSKQDDLEVYDGEDVYSTNNQENRIDSADDDDIETSVRLDLVETTIGVQIDESKYETSCVIEYDDDDDDE